MDPYVGEIRIFAGTFAPVNWLFCNGAVISIGQNEVLFQLIGTTYGGDGQSTFALPDLRSRVPIHQGTGTGVGTGSTYAMGQASGFENVTLLTAQLPVHTHPMYYAKGGQTWQPVANTSGPASAVSAQEKVVSGLYGPPPTDQTLNPAMITTDGQSQAHDNIQPYLALNYIICTAGIYPPQS